MWIKYYGHGFTHYTILLYTINFITWSILENTFFKHDNNYFFEITFSSYRPKSSGVGDAFVLRVSKKEMLVRQELIAVNRFLCCRGLPIIGPTDKVQVFRRGVANGSIFSSAKMANSKLKNSYTIHYEDASGKTQFGEIQRCLVIQNHHVALVTKLAPSGSLTSDIKSSSELLNRFSESGVLLSHMAVTRRSKYLFCIPLCNIKRKCIVVRSCHENNELTISTFQNMVEHDWLILVISMFVYNINYNVLFCWNLFL